MITIFYSACDGYRQRRTYKTLNGARRFAHEMLGEHPDMGRYYAVSDDGVAKIECRGCTLRELFPDLTVEPYREARSYPVDAQVVDNYLDDLLAAYAGPYGTKRTDGCTCSSDQLYHVGCDCRHGG